MSTFTPVDSPITLGQINTDNPDDERFFAGAFGTNVTKNRAAFVVVWFLKERGQNLDPFTFEEIEEFCQQKSDTECRDLNGVYSLIVDRHFMPVPDGSARPAYYQVTPEFLEACLLASPGPMFVEAALAAH